MKIAVFSDVHDNIERWGEAVQTIKENNIDIGVCCGDITNIDTLNLVSESFKKLYFCFGNADYSLNWKTQLFNKNVTWYKEVGNFNLDNRKISIIHNSQKAKELAKASENDIIFYGHSHTPWEEKVGGTILLNPGEICGREGKPTFAIFDTKKMKANLILLK